MQSCFCREPQWPHAHHAGRTLTLTNPPQSVLAVTRLGGTPGVTFAGVSPQAVPKQGCRELCTGCLQRLGAYPAWRKLTSRQKKTGKKPVVLRGNKVDFQTWDFSVLPQLLHNCSSTEQQQALRHPPERALRATKRRPGPGSAPLLTHWGTNRELCRWGNSGSCTDNKAGHQYSPVLQHQELTTLWGWQKKRETAGP